MFSFEYNIELRMREQDRDRQKAEWEMKERQASEAKQRNEMQMKHDVEEMQNRIKRTDEELHRRQQENNIFMQVGSWIYRSNWISSLTFDLFFRISKCIFKMMTTAGHLK